MTLLEAYLFLLADTIFGNVILYPSYEYIGFIMKGLGTYNEFHIFLVSGLGFFIAIIVNYFFGLILLKIYLASMEESKRDNYNRLSKIFENYGNFLLLLHLVPPFGNIVPLLCGFTRFSFWRALIIILGSKMIYYSYYILL